MITQPITLVLLPGMDGTGLLLQPLLEVLPDFIRPAVVTYPPDQPLTYRELKPHVIKQVPGELPFFLLGESFGGPLAIMIASDCPPNLKGLILCGTFAKRPIYLPLPDFTLLLGLKLYMAIPSVLRNRLLDPRPTRRITDLLMQTQRTVNPEVWAKRASEVFKVDCTEELDCCTVPLLFLVGSRDRLIPRRSVRLIIRLRPSAAKAEIDAPHLLLQHSPVEACQAIAQFINSTSTKTATNQLTRMNGG